MLGRLRKTTATDVGLSAAFVGLSYLVWSLVAGFSRNLMQEFIYSVEASQVKLPTLTYAVKVFFVDSGFLIDLAGLAWLILSLVLVQLSNRQRISISWAWVSAICQSFAAGLGAVLVGWVVYAPYMVPVEESPTIFVVWLLVERARLGRRGPSLRDGLRMNVFKT